MDFRVVPLCALLVYEGLALGWRSWLQWRYHGGHGIQLFRSGSWRQHLRDALFLALGGLLLFEAMGAARGQIPVADGWALRLLGIGLVATGTVFTVAAQVDLGASWRVGIEETARPGLVTTGWYAWSRNPIFFFMLLFVMGFAVLVPTPTSAGVAIASYLAIRAQVQNEEDYLLRAYGDAYREYARRVRRFVPIFWGLTSHRARVYSEIEKRFQF
jgi:protein-S-isoprenylcysteine O-methyltransferase Ste14